MNRWKKAKYKICFDTIVKIPEHKNIYVNNHDCFETLSKAKKYLIEYQQGYINDYKEKINHAKGLNKNNLDGYSKYHL